MFGAIKIATIRGIPIRLHITLLAVFALLILQFGYELGLPAGFILFGSVLLHELGHAVVAQRFGIRIAGIILHLMGGMALMTRPPEKPRHEILIAAAGPFVSLVLGVVLLAISFFAGAPLGELAEGAPIRFGHLLAFGAGINLMMAFFNLVPALPMDGGRIFRALLAQKMGTMQATRIAAWVSRAFGVVFVAYGLATMQISWMVIGAMLFLMVWNELRVAEMQEALRLRAEAMRETREEFVDPLGRRYVVITRLIE